MKKLFLTGTALMALAGTALMALTGTVVAAQSGACPAVTVNDGMGVAGGAFPQQFELDEFEALANCTLEFSENPEIGALNAEIRGNGDLPPLSERLPEEPLVVAPYDSIGKYGGTFDMLSNATEAGTSDILSVRHVNFVRYMDDLQTIVPNIAKGWEWNDNFTQLTFFLRKGQKWSDGAPFTADDVKFWYDNLLLDPNVKATPPGYALVAGERMQVEVIDPQTVRFDLPSPKPGLLSQFATSFAQGFQPKHFLGQFHPEINPEADALAQSLGFENGYAAIAAYYGNSDWTDTPTPLLANPEIVAGLPADVMPTLEAFLTVADSTDGRRYVANPYFFQVDTQGNQLPYISRQDEIYISENEVRILKLVNGEVDYKLQSLDLPSTPLLLDNQEKGDYTVELIPRIGMTTLAFNVTAEDMAKRDLFGDIRFRQAMSIAVNRDEINEVAFFGLGEARQFVGFSPVPDFVEAAARTFATEFDPDGAMALLDELGMVDTDGDGFRELSNGDKIVLNLQFTTQGVSTQEMELIGQQWANVGVQTAVKEVTTDEYRTALSSNQLDVGIWFKGQPVAVVLGDPEGWKPPFDDYFGARTAMLWGEWLESNGSAGVEPPEAIQQIGADIDAFLGLSPGTPESDALGAKLSTAMSDSLLYIGTVNAPGPVYRRNAVKNMPTFKTWGFEFYRTYPYRGPQWYLDE
ncbi:MAG: ABC transporter substrate-binding protein [Alphaproteobacteria bacterium]|nr:ABC transporter substrate-binding protein [Alphaproteobacteria bacterium]